MTTILVTGSTGTIGSRTVQRLASVPGVTVRAAGHDRVPEPRPKNVHPLAFDLEDRAAVAAAATGVDAVFLITPSVPHQVELAARAVQVLKAAGVPRLVRLSSIGADWPEPALFMREHAEIEAHVLDSGLPCTFLRPNCYMSNLITVYGPDPGGTIRLPWGEAGVSFVDPRDVADVAARVLTTEGHDGKAYTLTGPEAITLSEIAQVISNETGRGVDYVDTPEDEMRQGMLAQGAPPEMVESFLDLFATIKAGKTATVTDAARVIVDRSPRSFREFARDHARGWTEAVEINSACLGAMTPASG